MTKSVTLEPEVTDNPYDSFAERISQQLAELQLDGSAMVPGYDRGSPSQPRKLTYDEIAAQGRGWKLHLNFDAENQMTTNAVRDLLTALKQHAVISQFKIGMGGGKAHDAPGKEATVYIGHRDKANLVAPIIEGAIGGLLELPEGDTIRDDIPFTPRIMGRFQISGTDSQFHQYGHKGLSWTEADMGRLLWEDEAKTETGRARIIDENHNNAKQILTERYGVFFTGTESR